VSEGLINAITEIGKTTFGAARTIFEEALADYLKSQGGNEDAALKNTRFAVEVDKRAMPAVQ